MIMKKVILPFSLLFLSFAFTQSNGKSPEQFSQELAVMKHDLTIANDCENPKRLIVPVDTLNMNFHALELINVELHVRRIINRGDIIYRCGSVVIEVSQDQHKKNNQPSPKI